MTQIPRTPTKSRRQPLALHIILDRPSPGFSSQVAASQTEAIALNLTNRLASGDRSPKVPVRLWCSQGFDSHFRPPYRIPLDAATKNVVVVLVDQLFFENRVGWDSYLATVVRESKPGKDLILPVAIRADAARVSDGFRDLNHILVRDPTALADDERVFQAIYTALLRLMIEQLPCVFLCHAKADGTDIANEVRKYLYEQTQLSCFFDMHDIPHGYQVTDSIQHSISKSFVFVVWTDRLLDSPWCQFEIIEARRQQRPMLVLDAITTQTPRVFPFMGNMPVVRWHNKPAPIVSALLLELIRAYHLQAIFGSLSAREQAVPVFGLHPPDLLDSSLVINCRKSSTPIAKLKSGRHQLFIYPDPPLKPHELEILQEAFPRRRFLSLIEWLALRAGSVMGARWDAKSERRPNPFCSMRIGISVSESDTWADLGLIRQHQDELASDIALELILLGAKVVWGGDLRPDGLGSQLKWIVETYQHPSHPPQNHVALFMPFSFRPVTTLNAEIEVRRNFADVRVMDCPVPELDPAKVDSKSASGRALTAMALSVMRFRLAHECHARVLLGGRLRGFQGIYPGIIEEAFETVRAGRPLYILGGFGGAARAVYDAIADRDAARTRELLSECQLFKNSQNSTVQDEHKQWIRLTKRAELEFDPKLLMSTFSELGLAGLSKLNGLSRRENERLSHCQEVHEILELLVKGLAAIAPKKPRSAKGKRPPKNGEPIH